MLRHLLIASIHGYRRVARATGFSRTCLYDVSCSQHVERVARSEGAVRAIRAMTVRFARCRPGYSFDYSGENWSVTCVEGSTIEAQEASAAVRAEAAMLRHLITS